MPPSLYVPLGMGAKRMASSTTPAIQIRIFFFIGETSFLWIICGFRGQESGERRTLLPGQGHSAAGGYVSQGVVGQAVCGLGAVFGKQGDGEALRPGGLTAAGRLRPGVPFSAERVSAMARTRPSSVMDVTWPAPLTSMRQTAGGGDTALFFGGAPSGEDGSPGRTSRPKTVRHRTSGTQTMTARMARRRVRILFSLRRNTSA